MSWEATAWAMKTQPLSPAGRALPTAKLILLVLANYAGDSGECYPSIRVIATLAQQSENTVRARITDLVGEGLVFRTFRIRDNGADSSNEYVLLHDDRSRAYASSRGWVAPHGEQVRERPADAQIQLDLDDVDAPDSRSDYSLAAAPPFNCSEGEGATGCRGRAQLLGPHEPLLEPLIQPSPPNPLRGDLVGDDPSDEKKDRWYEFDDVFPWAPNEPKHPARRAFDRLNEPEQDLAIRYAKRYGDDCHARNRKVCFAKTWIRDKGWEPFAEAASKAVAEGRAPEMAWIEKGSDEAAAWDRRARAEGRQGLFMTSMRRPNGSFGVGTYKPTRWPPEVGPAGGRAPASVATMH